MMWKYFNQFKCGLLLTLGLVCLTSVFLAEPVIADVRCGEKVYHNYKLYSDGSDSCKAGQGITIQRVTKRIWGAASNATTESYDLNIHIASGESEMVYFEIIVPPSALNGSKVYSSLTIDSLKPDSGVCIVKVKRFSSGETTVICDGASTPDRETKEFSIEQ